MPFTISLATMWRRNLVLLIKGQSASVVSVAAGGVAGIGGIGGGAGAMGWAGLGSTLLKGPSSMRSSLPSPGWLVHTVCPFSSHWFTASKATLGPLHHIITLHRRIPSP